MDEYLIGLIGNLEEGPIGPGDWLPSGGNSGDVLRKNSDADYDAGWYAASSQPTADAVALFDANGNLKSGTPVEDEDVVTLYAFRNSELATEVQQIKAAFDADLVSVSWAPNITRGAYIKVLDGTVGSSNKYARTALWNGYGQRKAVVVDNPVYEFCLALYDATGNLDGTGYLRSTGYATGMQYIPQDAAMFGVSFRRVDQSVLTDDDSTAISAALSALAATDITLTIPGAAADAEATGHWLRFVSGDVYTAEHVPQGADYFTLEAGAIATDTGANEPTGGKAVKTKFITIPDGKDLYCVFDAPGYRWMSWSYTGSISTSGSHINAAWQDAEIPIFAKYVDGDKTIRIAFRRSDGADMQDSDISTIQQSMHLHYRPDDVDDLKAIIDKTTQDSINLVDMSSFASRGLVTVTHNNDGSVTFHAVDGGQGDYVLYTLLTSSLEPGQEYCVRMKITACSATDINGDPTTPAVSLRFRGDWEKGPNHLVGGIGRQYEPGDYVGMWFVSDQNSLVLVLTSGARGEVSDVTVSEIMVAKSDVPLPYIPYGITAKDSNVWAEAMASKYNRMSYGVANALANARQFTQVRYTLQGTLPTQFADYRAMFVAGKEVEGVVYSSARYYDKMVGLHVSLYTFLSAIYNQRSVLYTRRLLTSSSRTYYGSVCSAFVGHNFGIEQNFTADIFSKWTEKMQKIAMGAVRVGDVLDNIDHILLITDVAKDQYCRSVSVNYSEAGTPVAHRIMTMQWPAYLNLASGTRPYAAYRYLDIDNVGYTPSEFVKGYPDETPEYEDTASYPWPDIMCEFGDKSCFLINDPQLDNNQVTINVLDASGYDTITVSVDGVAKSTISGTPADFAVTLDEAGLWEITMTGPGKSSNTSFIVVDATCSYDTTSHVVSWQVNSGNAVLSAVYTYGWESQATKNIRNNYCWPTDAEMGSASGTKDLTDYLQTIVAGNPIDCTLGAKVALKTDYGVVSWLSTPELKLWEAVT